MISNRILWAIIILCLAGCGGPGPYAGPKISLEDAVNDPSTSKDFAIDCLGKVTSDYPIQIQQVAKNLLLAQRLLDEPGIMPRGDFCKTYGDIYVHVSDQEVITVNGREARGHARFDDAIHITLARDGFGLLHELLHVLDHRTGRGDVSARHQDWGRLHYNDVDYIYMLTSFWYSGGAAQ